MRRKLHIDCLYESLRNRAGKQVRPVGRGGGGSGSQRRETGARGFKMKKAEKISISQLLNKIDG